MKRVRDIDAILRMQARGNKTKELVGVGGCSDGCDIPDACDMSQLCSYYKMDAQSVATIAGQASAPLVFNSVEPWFVPVAVAMTVMDATDPGLDRRAFVTAVTIDGCRQLDIQTTAPTAATTQFIVSDDWDPRARSGCACKVSWGPYTTQALNKPLTVTVFNPYPVGINIRAQMVIYGVGYDIRPPFCNPDQPHNPRPRRPPVRQPGGNGTLTAPIPGRVFPPSSTQPVG